MRPSLAQPEGNETRAAPADTHPASDVPLMTLERRVSRRLRFKPRLFGARDLAENEFLVGHFCPSAGAVAVNCEIGCHLWTMDFDPIAYRTLTALTWGLISVTVPGR